MIKKFLILILTTSTILTFTKLKISLLIQNNKKTQYFLIKKDTVDGPKYQIPFFFRKKFHLNKSSSDYENAALSELLAEFQIQNGFSFGIFGENLVEEKWVGKRKNFFRGLFNGYVGEGFSNLDEDGFGFLFVDVKALGPQDFWRRSEFYLLRPEMQIELI